MNKCYKVQNAVCHTFTKVNTLYKFTLLNIARPSLQINPAFSVYIYLDLGSKLSLHFALFVNSLTSITED